MEQTCDIELDKRTTILPVDTEITSINFKALWSSADESLVENRETKEFVNNNLPLGPFKSLSRSETILMLTIAYEEILKDLLPRFPLTLPG